MDFERMLAYSAALSLNNNRPWFHENHKQYEAAKKDHIELLELLRFAVADAAPALADDILYMQAKDWTYRTARDMRYSRGKPPYEPSFRAYISPDRKSWMPVGYYLRIFPGESVFGTGLWSEEPENVNRVRGYFMENWGKFEKLRRRTGLQVSGDSLKRMPRGYPEGHPAEEMIKRKNWQVIIDVPDSELTDFEGFAKYIRGWTEALEPMRLLLMDAANSAQKTQKKVLEDFYNIQ